MATIEKKEIIKDEEIFHSSLSDPSRITLIDISETLVSSIKNKLVCSKQSLSIKRRSLKKAW